LIWKSYIDTDIRLMSVKEFYKLFHAISVYLVGGNIGCPNL